MKFADILVHEHKIILAVLDAAEKEIARMAGGGAPDVSKIRKMIDFFRNFADRCHHAKEEKQLFVKMEERGLPHDRGPIAVMLSEHVEGRGYVGKIAEAAEKIDAGGQSYNASLRENLSAYIGMLRNHIGKEDGVLYPMAERMFSADDDVALVAAFEKAEREETGESLHERYHALAHELIGK